MVTPIDRLTGLTPENVGRLCDQWITTVEQLASLAVHKQFRPFLSERLGLDYETLAGLLRSFYDTGTPGQRDPSDDSAPGHRAFYDDGSRGYRSFYDDGALGRAPGPHLRGKFGMGLRLTPVTVRSLATKNPYARTVLTRPLTDADLPAGVNLAPLMPPVRDQGERGTCLSFSTCAVREFLAPEHPDLSEQFFYWACKTAGAQAGNGDEGATIPMALGALAALGVCLEATWPYDPNPCVPEEGPTPSQAALAEARRYIWDAGRQILCRVETLKRILAGADGAPAQPAVIGVMVFDSSFFSPDVFRTGRITIPFQGEPGTGGHALCVVGYQDDAASPGGGYLIVRNSWGTRWATHGEYGAGYGLMPYAYLGLYGVDALSLAAAGTWAWNAKAPAGAGGKALHGDFADDQHLHGDFADDQHLRKGRGKEDKVMSCDGYDSGEYDLAAGAEQRPEGYICGSCGRTYASRFSLVRTCEVCDAMICQTCVRLQDRSRCRAHQEGQMASDK